MIWDCKGKDSSGEARWELWYCRYCAIPSLSNTCSIHGREVLCIPWTSSSTRRQYHTVLQGRFIACWIHLLLFFFSSPRANGSNKEHKLMKRQLFVSCVTTIQYIHVQENCGVCYSGCSYTNSHPSHPSPHLAREIRGKIVTWSYWNFTTAGDTSAEKLNLSQNPTPSLIDLQFYFSIKLFFCRLGEKVGLAFF